MVYWDPNLVVTENWWPTEPMYLWGRAGPSFYFANTLSTGRIDWIGNMRQNASLSLKTQTNYNIQTKDFIQDISLSGTGTWHTADKIGFTSQVTALAQTPWRPARIASSGDDRYPGYNFRIAGIGERYPDRFGKLPQGHRRRPDIRRRRRLRHFSVPISFSTFRPTSSSKRIGWTSSSRPSPSSTLPPYCPGGEPILLPRIGGIGSGPRAASSCFSSPAS